MSREVERFPDVTLASLPGWVMRDARQLDWRDERRTVAILRDALKFYPVAQTCSIESTTRMLDKLMAESGQTTRLEQVRGARTTTEERDGDVKPRTFGLINPKGDVVGAFEWSCIVVVRETEREIGLRGRSFPAFQFLLNGDPRAKASYVPWIRAHTEAIRAFMQAEFPGPSGKATRVDSVVVQSDLSTGNPLMQAWEDELARLVASGVATYVESPHPRIPEVVVRVISPAR